MIAAVTLFRTRHVLSIAEQKAKLAVEELKDYISNLKVGSVGTLFTQVKVG